MPEPLHTELFGVMPNRTRSGRGAVVVAFAPEEAIITALERTKCLVDPRRLENITLVAEVPPADWLSDRILSRRPSS